MAVQKHNGGGLKLKISFSSFDVFAYKSGFKVCHAVGVMLLLM
jgi:hypothetical protein